MSRKSLFCRKEVLCADGGRAQLAYYRLEEKGHGVLIEMRKNEKTEQGSVDELSFCPEKVNEILELLARNSVTPCTLKEILRDLATNFEKR